MAVTITLYNHTAKLFANGEVDLAALKVMLLAPSAVFNATNTTIADVSALEVSGNGWTLGGELISGVAVTTVTTNDAKLDGSDISVAATGGTIGPTAFGVLYDDTSNALLAFIDFGGVKAAGVSTDFKIIWNVSGIITWTYT